MRIRVVDVQVGDFIQNVGSVLHVNRFADDVANKAKGEQKNRVNRQDATQFARLVQAQVEEQYLPQPPSRISVTIVGGGRRTYESAQEIDVFRNEPQTQAIRQVIEKKTKGKRRRKAA